MKIKLPGYFVLVVFLFVSGCYIDTDTTDPQCSDDIATSKQSDFFLNEYYLLDKNKKALRIKEAWVEHCWKYDLSIFKKNKTTTSGLQLNLSIEDTASRFNIKTYLDTWRIKNSMDEYSALINNHCTLFMNNIMPPDSIRLVLTEKKSDGKFDDIEELVFVKQ